MKKKPNNNVKCFTIKDFEDIIDHAFSESKKDFNSFFNQSINDILAGNFLLGLDMGMACKCNSTEEAWSWVKRNFDVSHMQESVEKKLYSRKKCNKCNNQNTIGDLYCSKCGTKFC